MLYCSNLLGSDLRITNFGGGNTSAKVDGTDRLTGETVKVLWVKGSGGDIGSMKLDGFSTLYLDKLLSLKKVYRGLAQEDEMVALYNHCTFNLNPRATSIDTPLHGFISHTHVDHVHADALIAIAACENAEELTHTIYGDEMGFLPWQRPGFDLGLKLGAMAEANPHLKGVVLGGHGLFTWGPTSKACCETTLAMINKASAWLAANGKGAAFGGEAVRSLPAHERRDVAAKLLPAIRRLIFVGRTQDRKFYRRAGSARVRQFARPEAVGGARDVVPRSFPAHQDPPAGAALRPGRKQSRHRRRVALAAYRAGYAAWDILHINRCDWQLLAGG